MRQSSVSVNNTFYGQQPSAEDEETNYALISDSCTYYGDNSNNKTASTIPPAPPLNISMLNIGGGAPPPPPPPLPNGFGNGPSAAPSLFFPTEQWDA